MHIHDHTQGRTVLLNECELLPAVDGYQACKHPNGAWFVLEAATGATFPIHDRPQVLESMAANLATMDSLSNKPGTERIVEGFNDGMDSLSNAILGDLNESEYDKESLKAVFVVGSTGAGKSQAVTTMFSGSGYKIINQDTHLSRMLAMANIEPSDAGRLGWDAVQKAKRLADIERDQYAGMRLGLVIDGTGWSYPRISDPVNQLRALGYDCYMVHIDVSLDTAKKRNMDRGATGGRVVPNNYLEDAWYGLDNNADAYKRLFGSSKYFRVSNEQDLSKDAWEAQVGKQLRQLARIITNAPINNPVGKEWLDRPVPKAPPKKRKDDKNKNK